MRFLLGMIVGAALTAGLAYVHDAGLSNADVLPNTDVTRARPMVNWDVVSTEWDRLDGKLREQWSHWMAK